MSEKKPIALNALA